MKTLYICPFAHATIIDKPENISGVVPKEIQCSHLECGCGSVIFPYTIDDNVTATHVFYNMPKVGEIVSLEEQSYLDAGGLMFREIPENVHETFKKEFTATEGIMKLAKFMVANFPSDQRLPDVIDTAILYMQKYKGHLSLMKTLRGMTDQKIN